jgi:hypothetical protein
MEKILRSLNDRPGFKDEIILLENLVNSILNTPELLNHLSDDELFQIGDIKESFNLLLNTHPDLLKNLHPITLNRKFRVTQRFLK